MSSQSLFIGIILTIICISPFLVMSFNRKKQEHTVLKSLTEIALKHNSSISNYEYFGKFIIGMDQKSKQLFFLKKTATDEIIHVVNLNEIQRCYIGKTNRTNKSIDILSLNFIPRDKNKPEIVWEIYNFTESMILSGEFQFVTKWEKICTDCI